LRGTGPAIPPLRHRRPGGLRLGAPPTDVRRRLPLAWLPRPLGLALRPQRALANSVAVAVTAPVHGHRWRWRRLLRRGLGAWARGLTPTPPFLLPPCEGFTLKHCGRSGHAQKECIGKPSNSQKKNNRGVMQNDPTQHGTKHTTQGVKRESGPQAMQGIDYGLLAMTPKPKKREGGTRMRMPGECSPMINGHSGQAQTPTTRRSSASGKRHLTKARCQALR